MQSFIEAGKLFILICCEWCMIQACKTNERLVECYRATMIPGDLCPGVQRWGCEGRNQRCRCIEGTFQRWDAHCVQYRDCVFRAFDLDKLFGQQEELVMVGVTTTLFQQNLYKCFVTKKVDTEHHGYRRLVKYKELIRGRWETRQEKIKITVQKNGKEEITLLVRDRPRSLLLHANEHCVILGAYYPPYGPAVLSTGRRVKDCGMGNGI